MIDGYERDVRRWLAVRERQLRDIKCAGRHHGVDARCRYARRD